MSKPKKTATAKSDAARIAELEAQVAALTERMNPPKYEASPRANRYDPTASIAPPALPDVYDASAIEADLRAIGRFPRVGGESSGVAGVNVVEPQPQRPRANSFGEHVVDQICNRFLQD